MDKNNMPQIIYSNLARLLDDPEHGVSMRKLSTELGYSSGYIQKIVDRKRGLTLDTLNEISNYFDIPIWTFFIDHSNPSDKALLISELLSGLSDEALNVIFYFVQFIAKNDTVPSPTKKKKKLACYIHIS